MISVRWPFAFDKSESTTSAAEYGRVAGPVKAGLRLPSPAADGLDRACHPAIVCHQVFGCKEWLNPRKQAACQLFSLRHLYAGSDSRSQ